jgi:hypothetical protein
VKIYHRRAIRSPNRFKTSAAISERMMEIQKIGFLWSYLCSGWYQSSVYSEIHQQNQQAVTDGMQQSLKEPACLKQFCMHSSRSCIFLVCGGMYSLTVVLNEVAEVINKFSVMSYSSKVSW